MILLKFPNSAGMNPNKPFLLRLLEKHIQCNQDMKLETYQKQKQKILTASKDALSCQWLMELDQ
jgi:hypothetical protein